MDIVVHRGRGLVNITLTREELIAAIMALAVCHTSLIEREDHEEWADEASRVLGMFGDLARVHKEMGE